MKTFSGILLNMFKNIPFSYIPANIIWLLHIYLCNTFIHRSHTVSHYYALKFPVHWKLMNNSLHHEMLYYDWMLAVFNESRIKEFQRHEKWKFRRETNNCVEWRIIFSLCILFHCFIYYFCPKNFHFINAITNYDWIKL